MSEMSSSGPPSAPRRPATLGKYRLLKKIGMGGMAEIWVASVTGISGVQKICVVKQILPHLADSPEFVRMFLDEARIAASLDHPNLVQTYDVEEISGVPLMAMEYLHGEDLRIVKKSLKTAKRRMALEHAITITVGMTAGLHYAHEKVGFDGQPLNIVHRDVSPHNVFVTYDGAVKLLDFGIAKARNRLNETRDGALKGKVPYMSPEQCKGEPLDRRSDIYSTGILLYELSTGHRIFRRGSTEFELMRAIVEDPVVPPSQVMAEYPPELERIVLKCLSRNRHARYETAREMQVDLEAFAREARLATSSLALSSFMSDLFGQRVEAWRGALASEGELLSQIVERPRAELHGDDSGVGDSNDPSAPPSRRAVGRELGTKRSAPIFSPASLEAAPGTALERVEADDAVAEPARPRALTVTRRRLGGLQVVSLSGRMTEEFQGLGLARDLTGRVLFDLAGVQRVTSFGVREWLALLTEASSRVAELYLGRCSESIVNQVSMIRRFVGGGRVVSFYGPYRCERCGNTFPRLFDCETDAQILRTQEPPTSPCARCGATATFDDDAESYFAFAEVHAGVQLPADVRLALDELSKLDAAGANEVTEKTVDEHGTTVRVRAKLDANIRWKRALDGLEGDLVLDLAGVIDVTPEGAQALELALRSLGDEVRSIRIEACPQALLEHLQAAKPELRAVVATALVDATCERCNAPRPTLLDVQTAIAAALEGHDVYTACKRCNAPLLFPSLRPLLLRLGGGAPPPASAEPSVPVPSLALPEKPASEAPAPALPVPPVPAASLPLDPRLARRAAMGLLAAAALAILGLAYWRAGGPPSVPGNGAAPAASAAPSGARLPVDGPPSWATPPFSLEGDQVFVVGQGVGATKEAALALARSDALSRLASNMLPSLVGSPIHAFIQARGGGERRPDTPAAEAGRYLRQVGTFATPERVDAVFQERGGGVSALARYRMRKQDYDTAVQSYRRTASLLGLTVAPIFPLLERALQTSGEVVVVTVDDAGVAATAGVRTGDVVLAVNGRPVTTFDAFKRAFQGSLESATVALELEAGGERRTITLDPKNHR